MGLFCCCLRVKVEEDYERTCLLDDNQAYNEAVPDLHSTNSSPNLNSLYRTPSVGLTEQNLFDKTVQEMASKMINISSLNDQLPQTVWFDRKKLYKKKVLNIKNTLHLRTNSQEFEPKKKKKRTRVLFHERSSILKAISEEDMALINKFSDKSNKAVTKGFSFHSEEPIVVEFNPYNH